jgi:hypothetical protein
MSMTIPRLAIAIQSALDAATLASDVPESIDGPRFRRAEQNRHNKHATPSPNRESSEHETYV